MREYEAYLCFNPQHKVKMAAEVEINHQTLNSFHGSFPNIEYFKSYPKIQIKTPYCIFIKAKKTPGRSRSTGFHHTITIKVSYKTVTKLVIGMVASHDAPTF